MSVSEIVRNIEDFRRLEHILAVFLEEGFGYLIDKLDLSIHLPFHKKLKSKFKIQKDPAPVRLRRAFERLGPTFIKLAQVLSLRPDLVPKEYMQEFEKMQDSVEPFAFSKVKSIVEKELNQPISKVFKKFNEKPVASASVSQVHKAVLKNGKTVAVKVKRPNIDKLMQTDIHLMKRLADKIDKHNQNKRFHLSTIVDEFEKWTAKELKFKIESINIKLFRRNFSNDKNIVFPKVYDEFATNNLLVMEFIEGIPLNDYSNVKKKYRNYEKVIERAYSAILKQVFVDGFFHADPHPGNILVLRNGKIAFLDFGIVGRFSNELRDMSASIVYGIVNNDVERVSRTFMKFGTSKKTNLEEFKADLSELFDPLLVSKELKDIALGVIIDEAIDIAVKYGINVPADYVLLGKTIVTIEGIGLTYDPSFNVIAKTRPTLNKIMKTRYSLKHIESRIKDQAETYRDLITGLPSKTNKLLDVLSSGKLDIDIEDKDIGSLTSELERSSGNLAIGLIVAALIVGSALVMQISGQPMFYNIPLISLLGFIFAGLLGVWVVKRTVYQKFGGK